MSDVHDASDVSDMSGEAEAASKDAFFKQLADIASAMTAAHGKDFSMGALVLAARFIAEGEARERAAATQGQAPSIAAGALS